MNSKQHFFNELKKYSSNENQFEKEWIQISKHKKESPCICGHIIHHYAYVYNIENGHILTIGVGCCKKYGITQISNNILLLEFFQESGSLFYKNKFFDMNKDIDFIQFLNNKIERIQKLNKENLGADIKFYLREIEILKQNLEELIDFYHFYCGQNLLIKTNQLLETLQDFYVQHDVEEIIASQPSTPVEKEEYIRPIVNDVENDVENDVVNDVVNDENVEKMPTENISLNVENDESNISHTHTKYTFKNETINQLLEDADKALEKSPKLISQMSASIEIANYYSNETTRRLRKIRLGLMEIRLGFQELNKNIYGLSKNIS